MEKRCFFYVTWLIKLDKVGLFSAYCGGTPTIKPSAVSKNSNRRGAVTAPNKQRLCQKVAVARLEPGFVEGLWVLRK